MKISRKMKLVTLSLVSLLILPLATYAIGQLTEPIVVDNAAKGQVIIEKLVLFSSEKEAKEFGLVAEGDIANWTKFYSVDDLENPITKITIPAESNIEATVIISVPADAENGTYEGEVSLTSTPTAGAEAEGSQATAIQKVGRQVTITVIGEEQIAAEVSIIPVSYAVEPGQPLQVRFIIYNTGNVAIAPQIQAKIKDIDQKGIINTTIYPFPETAKPIGALERREIEPLKIATTDLADGRYWIEFNVSAKDQEIANEQFRFTVGQAGEVQGASFAESVKSKLKYVYAVGIVLLIVIVAFVALKLKAKKAKK